MRHDPYYQPNVPDYVPAGAVYDLNIYAPQHEDLDPFESFKRLQDIGLPDIFWTRNNGGHWIALRGDVITEIAKDTTHFSSRRFFVPDEQNFESDLFIPLMADPPEHTAYRKIAATVFTPRKILALEPSVRALTAALLRDLKPRGGCEFMSEFSLQMPIIVFMQLMNLPLEDRLELLDIAGRIVRPPAAGEQRDDALKSLFRYLAPIIGERRQHPGADMISTLSRAERAGGGHLTAEEVQGMTATLLIGGLDTVAASLGWFIRYLADNPAQRRRLIDEPGLIRAAAEELFRRFPVTTTGRNLTGDHEFGGLTFRRNDHVVWAAAMYNLDDRIFPNPMEVDFGRRRGTYLSLGHGPHFCLGATLAQLEFRIFLEEWLKHIPEFQVSAEQQAKYRSAMIIAYQSLPLVWAA